VIRPSFLPDEEYVGAIASPGVHVAGDLRIEAANHASEQAIRAAEEVKARERISLEADPLDDLVTSTPGKHRKIKYGFQVSPPGVGSGLSKLSCGGKQFWGRGGGAQGSTMLGKETSSNHQCPSLASLDAFDSSHCRPGTSSFVVSTLEPVGKLNWRCTQSENSSKAGLKLLSALDSSRDLQK